MAKLCLKKQSKRMSCRRRYKIEKKVREHGRKVNKESKSKAKAAKAAGVGKRKTERLVRIPNDCPFKEELLRTAQQQKEANEQKRLQQRQMKIETKKQKKEKDTSSSMQQLAEKAKSKATLFEMGENITSEHQHEEARTEKERPDTGLKAYAAEVRKVIEKADVVLEVLDARDPLGSRSVAVERSVLASGKRLVLLLNKVDLVPKANVELWLKHLRQQMPTLAFKASTQEQTQRLGRVTISSLTTSTSKCIGADHVMKLLKNYCRNKQIKTRIIVGVIGFPNVGKSSVINSLKRKKTCNVGATPGVTKSVQEVELDRQIRLLDSPGVVLAAKGDFGDASEIALKNAVRVEAIADPITPVHAILRRCSKQQLMIQYNIALFDDADEFLAMISKKMGRLKKGGRPDLNAAAKQVLIDWNSGKLRYYTVPPETNESAVADAQIVSEMAKEFDIDSLDDEQRLLVEGLPDGDAMDVGSPALIDVPMAENSDSRSDKNPEIQYVVESSKRVLVEQEDERGSIATKSALLPDTVMEMSAAEATISGNQQMNKKKQLLAKRIKKRKQKTAKITDAVIDAMDTGMDISMGGKKSNDAYDFDTDFL